MSDRFQSLMEKEKNREELVKAIHSSPIFDNWRQILTVLVAILIVAAVFSSRSKRFKEVLAKLEATPVLNTKRSKYLPKSQVADPDVALARYEKMWAKEELEQRRFKHAQTNGAPPTSEDEEFIASMAEDQKKRIALAGRLERIAAGDLKEALKTPPPKNLERTLAALAAASSGSGLSDSTSENEIIPLPVLPDSIGIGHMKAAHASNYREIKLVPSAYLQEREEFPDLD